MPSPRSSGVVWKERLADPMEEALILILKTVGRVVLKEVCRPESLDEGVAYLATPAGKEALWAGIERVGVSQPLLWPFMGQRGKAKFTQIWTWGFQTPRGRRVVRSTLEEVCSTAGVGPKNLPATRGWEEGSPTLRPGLATAIAQRVEACGCSHRGSVEACCDREELGRKLRAFDQGQLQARRSPLPAEGGTEMGRYEKMNDGSWRKSRSERLPPLAVEDSEEGEPTVNAGSMWIMATESIYSTSDRVALATREALQNGVDGVRKAVKLGKIARGEGFFAVEWSEESESAGARTEAPHGVLRFGDNGVGMDRAVFKGKFMDLGSSGKGGAGDESSGGFGTAKAVILGVSPSWDWSMQSHDWIAVSKPNERRYRVGPSGEFLQGVKLELRGISTEYEYGITRDYLSPLERIRRVLAWSHVPDVKLLLNGEVVESAYPARRGSVLTHEEVEWGKGAKVEVKSYRRSDTKGTFLIRLNGLFQFTEYGARGMRSDIVLEVTPTVRPGQPGYPFPPSRDSFRDSAVWGLRKLREILTEETKSGDEDREYDDWLPDASDPKERAGAAAFDLAMQSAADDPELQRMLAEMGDLTRALLEEEAKEGKQEKRRGVEVGKGGAPGDKHVEDDPYDRWRQVGAALPTEEEVKTTVGRKALAVAIGGLTGIGGDMGDLLTVMTQGGALNGEEGTFIAEHIQRAVPGVDGGSDGKGDTIQVAATLSQVLALLGTSMGASGASVAAVAQVKKKASEINPFGSAALIKVSRKNFDPARAKKFLREAKTYLPLLVAWESTLRLIWKVGGIRIPYKPGFVLDDSVNALTYATGESGRGRQAYVLVNPFKLKVYVDAHGPKGMWEAVANWIYTVGCHELAHLPHMGKHHGEDFIVEREALSLQTGHLLPVLTALAERSLGGPSRGRGKGGGKVGEGTGDRGLRAKVKKLEQDLARVEAQRKKGAQELALLGVTVKDAIHLRRLADEGGWDPMGVVDSLIALNQTTKLTTWLVSPSGVKAVGGAPNARIMSELLQRDPSAGVRLFRRIVAR